MPKEVPHGIKEILDTCITNFLVRREKMETGLSEPDSKLLSKPGSHDTSYVDIAATDSNLSKASHKTSPGMLNINFWYDMVHTQNNEEVLKYVKQDADPITGRSVNSDLAGTYTQHELQRRLNPERSTPAIQQ